MSEIQMPTEAEAEDEPAGIREVLSNVEAGDEVVVVAEGEKDGEQARERLECEVFSVVPNGNVLLKDPGKSSSRVLDPEELMLYEHGDEDTPLANGIPLQKARVWTQEPA